MENSQKIEIGNFIEGSYKFGCICGIVKQVLKNTVIIYECNSYYDNKTGITTVTKTNKEVSVTSKRISNIQVTFPS